jgi:hypothetical protein
MVTCARCGNELKPGILSKTVIHRPKFGEFKDKDLCGDCWNQVKPELEASLQKEHVDQFKAKLDEQPGSFTAEDSKIKIEILKLLNHAEVEMNHVGDFTMRALPVGQNYNLSLQKSIISLLKATLLYDELLLRKLDHIDEALAKSKNSGSS